MRPYEVDLYFTNLRLLVKNHPYVLELKIVREKTGNDEGFNQLSIILLKAYKLETFEYYSVSKGVTKFRYQLLDSYNNFIARWDNSPHHPEIKSYPNHVHTKSGISDFDPLPLPELLDDLDKFW